MNGNVFYQIFIKMKTLCF